MTAACLACGRPNGLHRSTCMYCGRPLPRRSAEEDEGRSIGGIGTQQVSEQLDSLVRQALSGQRSAVEQVKEKLGERSDSAGRGPVATRLRAEEGSGAAPRPVPPGVSPSQEAGGAGRGGDRSHRISSAGPPAPGVKAQVTPAPPPPAEHRSVRIRVQDEPTLSLMSLPRAAPVEGGQLFPSFRQGYGLVIDAPGDAELAPELGAALHLDVATARLHASARGPRLVLRHPSRAALEPRAAAVRDRLHIPAQTVSRELLQGLPPALCLVEANGWRLRVTTEPLWRLEDGSSARDATMRWVDVKQVRLVIPGQVEIRRFRERTVSRRLTRFGEEGMRGGSIQERLVVELLLEGETRQQLPVRLVEGVTDVRGLPGYVEGSTLRSVRAWLEQITARWPDARVLSRFSARVPDSPVHRDDGEEVLMTGWPAWEEYSSLCRFIVPLSGPAVL